jgi:hypothetical protein
MNLITSIAAAIGFGISDMPDISTAQVFKKQRGPAPAGKKWRDKNVYIPSGKNPNVEPTKIRNPKIAAQVQAMHDKWEATRNPFGSVNKQEPDPHSLTSIKKDLHVTRGVARMVKQRVTAGKEATHAPA